VSDNSLLPIEEPNPLSVSAISIIVSIVPILNEDSKNESASIISIDMLYNCKDVVWLKEHKFGNGSSGVIVISGGGINSTGDIID